VQRTPMANHFPIMHAGLSAITAARRMWSPIPLGKLLFYDKALSVNRNEACAFCHMPQTPSDRPRLP
jgi:cytochrome c peroxidase